MSKYYAVKKGKKPGIYNNWQTCKENVYGFSGAVYKSFQTLEEAQAYIKDTNEQKIIGDGLIAYVDGSYNIKTKVYGYGCVLIDNQKVIKEISDTGSNEEDASMRNVAGEIQGSLRAIEYAIAHNYPAIYIYYDYEGIQRWATGEWKANKRGTQEYVSLINKYKEKIDINFIKVLAHSGDKYNDEADLLAKKAVGI